MHWVYGKLKLTQFINNKKGNGQAEFSFTLNSQTSPIKFILDVYYFEIPQEMNNHPLRDADYNKAFYERRKDGSLAFGGKSTKSPIIRYS